MFMSIDISHCICIFKSHGMFLSVLDNLFLCLWILLGYKLIYIYQADIYQSPINVVAVVNKCPPLFSNEDYTIVSSVRSVYAIFTGPCCTGYYGCGWELLPRDWQNIPSITMKLAGLVVN